MKLLFVFLLSGFIVGLWFGVNIGKGNALYENPFQDSGILQDAHDSAEDQGVIEQGQEYLDDKKESVKEKLKEIVEDI
ncbi:hypothetical protein QNI23_002160 [Bermanella sp. WJH001]|uniref:hypothetical protein n=1 Tax=Bermanella sp. WJH001 TaxID=3048005 RepID=UPI0024BEA009|nr:hypothetical protein [Bermanella sp. WJH001]MDJ1538439.1 hypothetical protein [Bermanella sp. WJH001]